MPWLEKPFLLSKEPKKKKSDALDDDYDVDVVGQLERLLPKKQSVLRREQSNNKCADEKP